MKMFKEFLKESALRAGKSYDVLKYDPLQNRKVVQTAKVTNLIKSPTGQMTVSYTIKGKKATVNYKLFKKMMV